MAEGGQVLIPTLSGYYQMAGPGDADAGPEAEPAAEMTPMLAGLTRRNIEEGAATLRAARDAGVKIALGSDVSLGTAPEIQLMIRHGLTPAQALLAATSTAVQALGCQGFRLMLWSASATYLNAADAHVPGTRWPG